VQQTATDPSQKAKQSNEFEPVPGCELAALFQSKSRPTSVHESFASRDSTFSFFTSPLSSTAFPFRFREFSNASTLPSPEPDAPSPRSTAFPTSATSRNDDEEQETPASNSSFTDSRPCIVSPQMPQALLAKYQFRHQSSKALHYASRPNHALTNAACDETLV
jgi:hypothetical protein